MNDLIERNWKRLAAVAVWIILATVLGAASGAEQWRFFSLDYPGAASTVAWGINANGAVVGSYVDSSKQQHGFLLSGGKFTSIDFPGAISTAAYGINSRGDIVGTHVDATGLPGGGSHGYLLQQGSFTALDYPGHLNTRPQRISDDGQIVGCFHDTDTMGTMYGMLMSDGNFKAVNVAASMSNGVTPGANLIAGFVTDMMTGVTHGFLASNGNAVPFDFPFSKLTNAWDISPTGEVVGVYTDLASKNHGFLLRLDASVLTLGVGTQFGVNGSLSFTTVDFPGAPDTQLRGINSRGDIVGQYTDAAGTTHGFLLVRSQAGDGNE